VEDEKENAVNLVVSTAKQSSNMRSTLTQKIFETVSTLRQLFDNINISGDRKLSEIKVLTKKVSKLEDELRSCRQK
jgi:sensor domain CHASE-containing protein